MSRKIRPLSTHIAYGVHQFNPDPPGALLTSSPAHRCFIGRPNPPTNPSHPPHASTILTSSMDRSALLSTTLHDIGIGNDPAKA